MQNRPTLRHKDSDSLCRNVGRFFITHLIFQIRRPEGQVIWLEANRPYVRSLLRLYLFQMMMMMMMIPLHKSEIKCKKMMMMMMIPMATLAGTADFGD